VEMRLMDITGAVLVSHKPDTSGNLKSWEGVLCGNHFYPITERGKRRRLNYVQLTRDEFDAYHRRSDGSGGRHVSWVTNGRKFLKEGYVYTDKRKQESFEKHNEGNLMLDVLFGDEAEALAKQKAGKQAYDIFRTNMGVRLEENFTYPCDVTKIRPLSYRHEDIETTMRVEYDLIKAYPNTSKRYISDDYEVPVFSFRDLWEVRRDKKVRRESYYYLSREALDRLRCWGFTSNLLTGHMAEFLMKHKKITLTDLVWVKHPTAMRKWKSIRDIFAKMEASIGESEWADNMIFYNGRMGRTHNNSSTEVRGLPPDDACVLKVYADEDLQSTTDEDRVVAWRHRNVELEWEKKACGVDDDDADDEEETMFLKYVDIRWKWFNALTVYNAVIDNCSRIVLDTAFRIDAMPVKVQTDALGYAEEQSLTRKHSRKFKVLSTLSGLGSLRNKQRLTKSTKIANSMYCEVKPDFVDGGIVRSQVLDELERASKRNKFWTGAAGSGKTHKAKNSGIEFDQRATLTNACKHNMGGGAITLSRLFKDYVDVNPHLGSIEKRMSSLKGKTIWIDEVSMLTPRYLNMLTYCSIELGTSFLLTGDMNQLPPIHGRQVDAHNDPATKALFGEVEVVKSEKNWRYGDGKIGKICEGLSVPGQLPDELMKWCEQLQQTDDPIGDGILRHLVHFHTTRMYVNELIMNARKWVFDIEADEVSPGVYLQCVRQPYTKKDKEAYPGIHDSVVYRVQEDGRLFDCTTRTVVTCTDPEQLRPPLKWFDVGFAVTTHSYQGLEFDADERFCVWDVESMMVNRGMLYTAVSRCKVYEQVYLHIKTRRPIGTKHYNPYRSKTKGGLGRDDKTYL
jgi:hypothetical protein